MSEITEIKKKAVEWYINNRQVYKKLSSKVETILSEILELQNLPYHIITSRAKDIDSFKKKAENDKYSDPVNQITDLAGIRVITYVEDEIIKICKVIEDTFDIDKENSSDKSKELGIDKVGYKSVHYIGKIKPDRLQLPEYSGFAGKSFEIQVRTILQHAWAEIEHDRNYKFTGKLPDEISRRFKLLAGFLEIADREFNYISLEIDKISKEVEEGTKTGDLNFELNSTSLKQYIETKFKDLIGIKSLQFVSTETAITELEKFDIKSLAELDAIIPEDFIETFNKLGNELHDRVSVGGLIRLLLIIKDVNKYFTKAWGQNWHSWSDDDLMTQVF